MDIKSVLKEMVVYGVSVEKTRFSDVDSVVEQIITMFPSWKSEEDVVRNAVIELMTEGKTPAQLAEMAVKDMLESENLSFETLSFVDEYNSKEIAQVGEKVEALAERVQYLKDVVYQLPSEWQYKSWKGDLIVGLEKIENLDKKVTVLYFLVAVVGIMAFISLLVK